MKDEFKTREQLIGELAEMRRHIAELERTQTGHRLAERDMQQVKENFRRTLEEMPIGIHVVSKKGETIYVNQVALDIFGYGSVNEWNATPVSKRYTPKSYADYIARMNKISLNGEYAPEYGVDIIRKDGTTRNCHIWRRKTVWNGIHCFQVFFLDVTENKLAEEALRESEQKIRALFDHTLHFIGMLTPEGTIIKANRTALDFAGIDESDCINKPFWDTPWWTHSAVMQDKLRAAVAEAAKGKTSHIEVTHPAADGSIHDVDFSVKPIYDDHGKIIFLIAEGLDVTELKHAEEERQALEDRLNRAEKMEALGTMAGGVAHDLNNLLGIIVGYAELLMMDEGNTTAIRPKLENIMKGGQRAAAIVDDLLTLARRSASSRQVLNLNRIIADTQQSPEFERIWSYNPSVIIRTDLEPDLLNISGSAVHLGKSLLNLVSNACEAMPNGGTLTVKTANSYVDMPIQGYDEVREGDYVVLSVSDTGEGIPAVDLQRIFEPFYTKKVMGRSGTGLGLAVVWGTVKDHHGYINVESEEEKGSTFTLYFPVTRQEITSETASVATSEYMGKGESILVVDDIKEQRDLAAGMLRSLNYDVACASSGEEALEYLKNNMVDLMVLDMIMEPGMDGLDTYMRVLEIKPVQKAIIVSGFSESERVHEAQIHGAGAYVKKPYVIEKLGLAVRTELDKR